MSWKDPESEDMAPPSGGRREVMNGPPGTAAGDDSRVFLTFRRVLTVLVVLCLMLGVIVWWQILRGV
jgi:hypothetical protein